MKITRKSDNPTTPFTRRPARSLAELVDRPWLMAPVLETITAPRTEVWAGIGGQA